MVSFQLPSSSYTAIKSNVVNCHISPVTFPLMGDYSFLLKTSLIIMRPGGSKGLIGFSNCPDILLPYTIPDIKLDVCC